MRGSKKNKLEKKNWESKLKATETEQSKNKKLSRSHLIGLRCLREKKINSYSNLASKP